MKLIKSIKKFFDGLFSSPLDKKSPKEDTTPPPKVSTNSPEFEVKEIDYTAKPDEIGEIVDPEENKKEKKKEEKEEKVSKRGITEQAYAEASRIIGCESEVNAIKAVAHVESRGSGFLKDGRPKILFEAHWFGKLTNDKYNQSHPDISSARWDRSLYVGGAGEHKRLEKAIQLNREAALQSCSWGKFQIMGFNYRNAGYNTVQEFVNAMWRSESDHLIAFTNFVNSQGISKYICAHNWDRVGYHYNGSGYKANNYHVKMRDAHALLETGQSLA